MLTKTESHIGRVLSSCDQQRGAVVPDRRAAHCLMRCRQGLATLGAVTGAASVATELRPELVGNLTGEFYVPSYQRGYRWGRDEVTRLLEDIDQSVGGKYYLQPIVVKRRSEDSWELVDGQQRLTTLFLILNHIRRHLPTANLKYSLEYETRAASGAYLQDPHEEGAAANIDFFHIYEAHKCVCAWFEERDNAALAAINFYKYLSESVYVIWYEAPAAVDSIALFTRLNVGRIPLTDAELVKALILSRIRGDDVRSDRAQETAAHWDSIERDLRAPEVWAFLTAAPPSDDVHINLLLDTLAGGPTGPMRPPFYTFETLRPQIEAAPKEVWSRVVDLHSLVIGWYENRNLYHKIGYLIFRGVRFGELVERSRNTPKHQFEAELDKLIRDDLGLSVSDLADLRYGGSKAERVLLLMNVETVRATKHSSERYSFREHARGAWSLEHIHARNAAQLTTAAQWRDWLMLHRRALLGLPNLDETLRSDLVERIDAALLDVSAETFEPLEQELSDLFTAKDDDGDIDSIANLALLGGRDNSALSNSVFEVKRRLIIERDKAGSYIPICTRNVFLKYYTEAQSLQIHFWGAADREGYLTSMMTVLRPYLLTED